MIANTLYGKVQGFEKEGFNVFLGIPYGVAKRFKKSQNISWSGVCVCTSYGNKPVQSVDTRLVSGDSNEVIGNEDCLNLNIWSPKEAYKFPVVIDIYGGAFTRGSNSNESRTGLKICEHKNYIYVSINYRLGIWGFLKTDEILGEEYKGSENNGINDIVLAIKWVYDNISFFGGDNTNITLMGNSAGGKAISALMAHKYGYKYFNKAIISSGGLQTFRSKETAQKVADRFFDILGEKKSKLLTLDTKELLMAQKKMCDGYGATCLFGPVLDGDIFPESVEEVTERVKQYTGSIMNGSNKHEQGFLNNIKGGLRTNMKEVCDGLLGQLSKYVYEYVNESNYNDNDLIDILSDYMYRLHASRLSKLMAANGNRVWSYSFDYGAAVHALDYTLLWKEESEWLKGNRIEEIKEVGANLRRLYENYIVHGNPTGRESYAWPCYDLEGQVLHINKKMYVDKESIKYRDFPAITYVL